MKRYLLIMILLCMILFLAGTAGAVSTIWTDMIDWNPNVYLKDSSGWGELSDGFGYHHDISDDGFASIFMGGDDTISSFSLTVSLIDDKDCWYTFESAKIITPLYNSSSYDFSLENQTYGGSLFGWIDLMLDGTLNVYIEPTAGDFYANWSRLTVYGDDGGTASGAPVPEPATMMLMGTGLIGLAGVTRKKIYLRK